jgi:hypothetical protein
MDYHDQFFSGCSEETVEALTSSRFKRHDKHFAAYVKEHFDVEKRPRNIEHYAPHSFDCLASFALFRGIWAMNTNILFNELLREESSSLIAAGSISMYLDTMLESVISEMNEGRATACSSLARSVGEACDIYLAILQKPSIAADYIQWEEGFYKFWRKHVSKEKLTPLKTESIRGWDFDKEIVGDLTDWYREEASFLSESTHPSYRAGLMVVFEYGESPTGNPYEVIWPPSRAVRYIMMSLLPVILHPTPFKDFWVAGRPEREYALLCIKKAIGACNAMRDQYKKDR